MKKRSVRVLWLLLLLSVGSGTLLFVFLPREPLLLNKATRVAETGDWAAEWDFYRWINNHEILFLHDNRDSDYDWNFYKRDTISGQQTPMSGISALTKDTYYKHSLMEISPDGKRIFWTGKGITVATLEGKQLLRLDPEQRNQYRQYGQVAWTGDGNHLLAYPMTAETYSIPYGALYDLKTPKAPLYLTVSPHASFDALGANNHLLTAVWESDIKARETGTAEIEERIVGQETKPPQKYSVRLPHKSRYERAVFSPQGDRVAWILYQPPRSLPPFLEWIQRHIPAFNPQGHVNISLWVSRIDGSQMHEVGCVIIPANNQDWENILDNLQWLPDGKHLSFRQKDALYTVPAD